MAPVRHNPPVRSGWINGISRAVGDVSFEIRVAACESTPILANPPAGGRFVSQEKVSGAIVLGFLVSITVPDTFGLTPLVF